MDVSHQFKFQKTPPDRNSFIAHLKEHTGLMDINMSTIGDITHPHFGKKGFGFVNYGDGVIGLNMGTFDSWYLWEAAQQVLLNLGGKGDISTEDLPPRAQKKWEPTTEFEDTVQYEGSWRVALFASSTPSTSTILEQYRRLTGLSDISLSDDRDNDNLFVLEHSLIPIPSIRIDILELDPPQKSEVALLIAPNNKIKSWYFVEALLATFVDLGGEVFEFLPEKAWKKWQEAQYLYPIRN